MKILNLYAGVGGNRKLWQNVEVTAVEYSQEIAAVYQKLYPQDKVVVEDAHAYLLNNYANFDFIWSSPPCQSHSRMIRSGRNRKPRYPNLKLYEEILFLKHNFAGKWVVENVKPYYEPLVRPSATLGRHLFWSNFRIPQPLEIPEMSGFIMAGSVEGSELLKNWLGIQYEGNIYYEGNHDPAQVLRNCVHPSIGQHVLSCVLSNNRVQPTGGTVRQNKLFPNE